MNNLVMRKLFDAKFSVFIVFFYAMGFANPSAAQISAKNYRKQAIQYYELSQFRDAASIFASYCPTRPKDTQAWLWWAESQFESNDLEGAQRSLQHIEKESKRSHPDVLLLLAKTKHQQHEFAEAIKLYKRFLSLSSRDQKYQAAVNDVKRCATGLKYNYISDQVLVENMGAAVNSAYDDFAPIESPNFDARVLLLFHSCFACARSI